MKMVLKPIIRYHHFHKLLNLQNPHHSHSFLSSISHRPFSLSPEPINEKAHQKPDHKKPLSSLFRISESVNSEVGNLAGKVKNSDNNVKKMQNKKKKKKKKKKMESWNPNDDDGDDDDEKTRKSSPKKPIANGNAGSGSDPFSLLIEGDKSLSRRRGKKGVILEVEKQIDEDKRSSKDGKAKEGVRLLKRRDFGDEVRRELSPDMKMFAKHLHAKGYLRRATSVRTDQFDSADYESSYGREFLNFAAFMFGRGRTGIAKWLSASDLKKVALFGCPSLTKKSVRDAKHIRKFLKIDEQKVCEKCTLKESCAFANKQPKKDASQLDLGFVTRVLVSYALESNPENLVVPDDVKNSVSRLLQEIVNLSRTLS